MIIDLRSDTFTKPTPPMLDAMMTAEVGDDVFREDPSVIKLEQQTAAMFGHETGLFCPSGTMTNQIAIKVHTQPGDEVICDKLSHVYNYEGGGIAFHSGCSVKLVEGSQGRFTDSDVMACINADDVHYPRTRLVCIENTCNRGGGSLWDLEEIKKIKALCLKHNLGLHLDGARIFNAIVASGITAKEFGNEFDSISVCFSKGMGAPIGSVLTGSEEFIYKARRIRKVFGGGMRQAGFLAAAGLYALNHNIDRMKDDHRRARQLEAALNKADFVSDVLPVQSNVVVFNIRQGYQVQDVINALKERDIKTAQFGKNAIRMVTHLDIGQEMIDKVCEVVGKLKITANEATLA